MAPGRRGLSKVQFAKEVTNGTGITTATALWRGNGGFLEDTREVAEVEEMIGIFDGADRTYIAKIDAGLKLDSTPATYEQFPYILAMAYGGPVAGVADGTGGTGFKYTTNIPYNAAPTNTSYTIQTGDDQEAEYATYCKITKFDLSGDQGRPVSMTAEVIGQQVQRLSGGLTAAVAVPSVEDVLTGTGKLYLDNVSGTAGTTQISQQLLAFKLSFEAMWIKKYTTDGNLYWSFAQFTGKKISGELTFEHDPTSIVGASGEKTKWRSQTPRLLQLKFEGSAYTTPGTSSLGKRTLTITLPIKWTKFDPIDHIDGNNIVKASFVSNYNAVVGNAGSILVSNEVTTLP